MPSRENLIKTLNHEEPDRLLVDFGATTVTGFHTLVVEKLRDHFGLEKRLVKVHEPFQFLGLVEEDLQEALNVDVLGLFSPTNMFGHRQENWKEFRTPWGQIVLVPGNFNTLKDDQGDILMYPQGDLSVPPSAKMPKAAFFFDATNRQSPINENTLNPGDNLEEFSKMTALDLAHFKEAVRSLSSKGKGVVAGFGGTHIGNIAFVPGMSLKHPRGIRAVDEWYMSILMRTDYMHEVFEKQTELALYNLAQAKKATGDLVDVVYLCGTDFGTQNSSFFSTETFDELFAPYYRKINDWIHENTQWKTFKHCCGAIEPFLNHFIKCGFDIINPVQISAAGMDPVYLKERYGDRITFWGGGVDTQNVLPYGTPAEVKAQVHKVCEIFSPGGGFVFNPVHNLQANVPFENILAMLDALREIR